MDDDEPHEIWFYSRDGEKHGPVSFTALQAKAKEASLNPRLDMVWTKGMDEWKLAGDIEGLFKRRVTEPPEIPVPGTVSTPAAGPYQPPQEQSVEEQLVKEGGWPGARRRIYLLAMLLLPAAYWVLEFASPLLVKKFGEQTASMVELAVLIVPLVVIFYINVQRLVNLGMSGWWVLGNFVPILNLWLGYRCFACPAGYAHHKKLDIPGVLLAILYWLGSLLAILSFGLAIGIWSGVIGSPELRKKVIDAYQEGAERKRQEIDARHK